VHGSCSATTRSRGPSSCSSASITPPRTGSVAAVALLTAVRRIQPRSRAGL
jgi:hypothetical protein